MVRPHQPLLLALLLALSAAAPAAAADGGAAAPTGGGGAGYAEGALPAPAEQKPRTKPKPRPKPRVRSGTRRRGARARGHRFPVVGAFSYGGRDARFGARRSGHRHQGQDLTAAEGTPLVAPWSGVVETVQYQAGGAGHYVVLDGDGEDRDYVFMHLRSGSIPVRKGQRVRTGQLLGEVGNTGRSSGPHLHFEIWVGGWYSGGRPIDPLPLLRAWAPSRT